MDRDKIGKAARSYISQESNEQFRAEVEALIADAKWDELNDRFYTDLEFGTGGLRGVIGGGYNRMNSFVVRRATQGLARYVVDHGVPGPDGKLAAVIAHDSRHFSDEFSLQAALVLCAHGIRTYLFPTLRPTPELSFAVRKLGASTGIVVTASHNPPKYNGYKVYWNDGSQVVPPHDEGITAEVRKVAGEIRSMKKEDAVAQGLLVYVDREIDDAFAQAVRGSSLRPELVRERGRDLKIVYTPLHGTGAAMVERVLGELGIQVRSVPEQREPDGDFPTVEYPNPEEASALKMALDLGLKEKADLVMGTDPDADRLGIAVPEKGAGGFRLITGNQLGVLLADYMFLTRKELATMPARPAFVKTIVTTELQRLVAEKYGVTCYDTLTGFKWIAQKIREFEAEKAGPTYVMGDEESYGYLIGTYVRDKDAVTAAVLTAEMALYHVSRGKSVLDRLNEIYRELGFFQEDTISHYFPGQEGQTTMKKLMDTLRQDPPAVLGGAKVVEVRDYLVLTAVDIASGKKRTINGIPASNVLQFVLEGNSMVSCRPSGTEPKIKFYASVAGEPGADVDRSRIAVGERVARLSNEIKAIIGKLG
ncbi:MAG TPA: phospho-sugar mutase [Spirochaetia bacterium]|nr:phospho-sugar mutase [Spirochaetia bacterium]